MADNKFTSKGSNSPSAKGKSIFGGLERRLSLENYFEAGFPVHYLPKVLFVLLLAVAYINNTHHSEKATREINKALTEVEDLRADFTTLKASVMLAGKQSEVARRVKSIGLEESLRPPYKIIDN